MAALLLHEHHARAGGPCHGEVYYRIGIGALCGKSPPTPAACVLLLDRYFRSSNWSSRRMTGLMKTNSVESLVFRERLPKRYFNSGISPSTGIVLTAVV